MKIPFSLPVIDDEVIAEMHDTLTHTGWLTTGPKARALEDEIRQFTGGEAVLCVNSWSLRGDADATVAGSRSR